jgi:hypothetical protein
VLKEKLDKKKIEYFKLKNVWLYNPEMVKLPCINKQSGKDRMRKLQFIFVMFKHCETKNYVTEYLKESRIPSNPCIDFFKNKEKTNKTIFNDDTKFLGKKVSICDLYEPDELHWKNLPFSKSE